MILGEVVTFLHRNNRAVLATIVVLGVVELGQLVVHLT